MDQETRNLIDERKHLRLDMMLHGKQANCPRIQSLGRLNRKRLQQEQANKIEETATLTELAHKKQDSHELYKCIRSISSTFRRSTSELFDQDGTLLTETPAQLNRLQEYFSNLLNPPDPTAPLPNIPPADEDLLISLSNITEQEVKAAIPHLRHQKTSGPDQTTPDELKTFTPTLLTELTRLFNRILKRKTTPAD